MKQEENCPVCGAFIEIEDGVGYCILCEDVVYFKDGKLTSDIFEKYLK